MINTKRKKNRPGEKFIDPPAKPVGLLLASGNTEPHRLQLSSEAKLARPQVLHLTEFIADRSRSVGEAAKSD